MKNRKGIIKMNKEFIQNVDTVDEVAESLFSNFYPTKIDDSGDERIYYGRSPLFRELKDCEQTPVYKCYYKHVNSKIVFGAFEEVKTSVDPNLENKSLKRQIKDLKFQLSCYKKVANNCYGVFDNENDLNLVKVIEKLRSENESLKEKLSNKPNLNPAVPNFASPMFRD